ncbi:nitrous oxide reductase accessory protein NosL [Magnetospirillum sp. UT-4]|uniref:nitrous oxide reductase accessory protein NosL n=1 Tax=Magnetospirillum sp. UT-4 TaxID=2681467 RepID=UPI0020C36FB4|nr:nitrous oxide reductase accessory protein NosL [Magnetospirillum sp. UT-4]
MSRRFFIGLAPGLVLTLAGCGEDRTGPVSVRWGKEYCEYCGMIVDDPRYAAQVRAKGGRAKKFDDLGDAVLWLARQPFAEDPATEFWVGDCEKGVWLDGRMAWYLEGRKSPMGHNFGAVPDGRAGAVDFAAFRRTILERGSTSRCETPTQGST